MPAPSRFSLDALRGRLERFVSRRLLKSSFSLAEGQIMRLWRVYFWMAALLGVLGLVIDRSFKMTLIYGGLVFSMQALSVFLPGRNWPGALVIAALADFARLVGLLPASPYRSLRPASCIHGLYAFAGLAGLLFLAVAVLPVYLRGLTGWRMHMYITDVPLIMRVAWFTVILFHLAVTSYCLDWCRGAEGRAVYTLLHLPALVVAFHLPMLTFDPDYTKGWMAYLEVGFLGLCSLVAARLYWHGWQIRRLKPGELLDCLRAKETISGNSSTGVSRTASDGPELQETCGIPPPATEARPSASTRP